MGRGPRTDAERAKRREIYRDRMEASWPSMPTERLRATVARELGKWRHAVTEAERAERARRLEGLFSILRERATRGPRA